MIRRTAVLSAIVLVALAAVVASEAMSAAAGTSSVGKSAGNRLAGTWLATVNRPAPLPPLRSLQIFTDDGSAIETSNEPPATRLVVGAAAALPGPAPATSSDVRPETLAQAREIRAQVTARYRLAPGRKLSVTEATSMAVLDSLTLLTTANELRVVPTDDGIYFAICSARARCPYPARAASWPASAFLPRRQALELAVRTFLETSATLVVVALPTAEPVWLVFERNDLTGLAAPALRTQLTADPEVTNAALRHVVDQLTLPRLFVPVAIVPVSGTTETMLAVSLDNGR